jgi:PPK2 family polyphosphate:nucleotide phosphotransferase
VSHSHRKQILRIPPSLRVAPGSHVDLTRDFDPAGSGETAGKKQGKKLLKAAVRAISDLQYNLAAQEHDSVLFVIQALDAGGKDGTIRHVFSGVNPAGVAVHSFKQPTDEELAHGYLWRYEQKLPGPGQIAVFNRSHYEEVLVVRVHPELLRAEHEGDRGPGVWERRYAQINEWEHALVGRGTRIVKLMLHISNEEQRVRFLRRCDLPEKHWKFSAADIREREHWDEYQEAFSQMLSRTSTEWAPWHVIPADHKWFARLASASALLDALVTLDPQIPDVGARRRDELAEARADLEAQAPRGEPADPVAQDPDEYR